MDLTSLANLYRSDKGNTYKCAHNYTVVYERLFRPFVGKPMSMLEIGLNVEGCVGVPSAMMWSTYFGSESRIFGFDILPAFKKFETSQIKIFIGDQSKDSDLRQCLENQYDIVIDDGYHATAHQLITFKTLWKSVKSECYYVIEDLHWQPTSETAMKTKEYFMLLKGGKIPENAHITEAEITRIMSEVESIEFYDSESPRWDGKDALCVIKKRKLPRSFDVFDTLLARRVSHPHDIFSIVEEMYPFKDFRKIRVEAEARGRLTYDGIYATVKSMTGLSDEDIQRLKEFEFQVEKDNSYLIVSNCNEVSDGDILISDMYLSSAKILELLRYHGFHKDVKVYSSSCGVSKNEGSMYKHVLNEVGTIVSHTGDNYHSDVRMAAMHGIPGILTEFHKISETEQFFITNGQPRFGFMLREFRHRNPHPNKAAYLEQVTRNIPILVMLSMDIAAMMTAEKRDTLLCLTRDGCLLEFVFRAMFPRFTTVRFNSSRLMHIHPSQDYKNYVRNTYNHERCMLFDGHGSFRTGRNLYMELFGCLPRIHYFSFNRDAPEYSGLTYSIETKKASFESFNIDTVGTLVAVKDGEFIRDIPAYDVQFAEDCKQTVISFCEFMRASDLPSNTSLLSEFSTKYVLGKQTNCPGAYADQLRYDEKVYGVLRNYSCVPSKRLPKIVLVAHGWLPIPPRGWGAIETIVWDSYISLKKLGYDVLIVNTHNKTDLVNQVVQFTPDIVHLHWDEYYELLPKLPGRKIVTTHNTALPLLHCKQFHAGDFTLCMLSQEIHDKYTQAGFPKERAYAFSNGANPELFKYTPECSEPNKTIYLAEIRDRKRQYKYTSIPSLYFAGPITTSNFTITERYLGVWDRNTVHNTLTRFANLALLSSEECHSLAVCEALMCGLGVVVSEQASANLDRSKPWITVIPTDKLDDIAYVEAAIIANRSVSVTMRNEIREYAIQNFSLESNIVKLYTHIAQLDNK